MASNGPRDGARWSPCVYCSDAALELESDLTMYPMVNDYYLVVLVTMVAMMDTSKQIINAGTHHNLSQHS